LDNKLSCPWAEQGLALHNTGRALLCCHSRSYLEDDNGDWIYWHSHTLDDAWNSKTRHEIIDSLAQGIEHPNCDACWQEERVGRKSRRIVAKEQFDLPPADSPKLVDLKLGNTCNLACTMCWPEVSSKWLADYYHVYEDPNIIYSDYKQRWASIQKSYDRENHQLWDDLKRILPNAEHLDIFGAEPFLLDRLWDILKWNVELGHSKNQTLHINTNTTIWRDDYVNILSHYKKVSVDLSIDATDHLFEYIRYGAEWQIVQKNIQKWAAIKKTNKNINVALCVTVTNTNVFDLDNIYLKLREYGLAFFLNIVHMPVHQCIRSMPSQLKTIINNKLRDNIDNLGYKREVESLLNFMMLDDPDQEANWQEWLRSTYELEKRRGNSLRKAAPEFISVLDRLGYHLP